MGGAALSLIDLMLDRRLSLLHLAIGRNLRSYSTYWTLSKIIKKQRNRLKQVENKISKTIFNMKIKFALFSLAAATHYRSGSLKVIKKLLNF